MKAKLADFNFFLDKTYGGCTAILRDQQPEINGLGVSIYRGHYAKDVVNNTTGACQPASATDSYLNNQCHKIETAEARKLHPKLIRYLQYRIKNDHNLV